MAFCAALLVLAGAACSKDDAAAVPESQGSGTTKVTIHEVLTVQLDTVGTLAEKIGDESSTVQKLVISGPINAVDVRTIRSLPELLSLDLKEAILCGGDSTYSVQNWANVRTDIKLYDKEIGAYMFTDTNLGEIILPDSLEDINEYAFSGLFGVEGFRFTSIVIPEGVKEIQEYAFENCRNLSTVDLPEGLTTLASHCFASSGLTSITIPESVTSYGNNLFEDCGSLRSVTLPQSIKGIWGYMFSGCSSLTDINIPEGVEIIHGYAFEQSGIKNIKIPNTVEEIVSDAFASSSLENLTIPESVKKIGARCFQYCGQLETVELLGQMTTVPNRAFAECSSLKTVTLSEQIETLENSAFSECSSLESVIFPTALRSIGEHCFTRTGFREIVLPENLETMGYNAFGGCSSLESVTIQSCESIGSNAFYECHGLLSVILPDNLKEIGQSAFEDCRSLETITIPDGCESIGSYAFIGCSNLSSITIPKSVKTVGYQLLRDAHPDVLFWNTSIAVPDDLFRHYSTSPNHNMLLYLADGSTQVNAPEIRNIIVNGMADALILTGSENGTLYVPQPFKAMKCTYTQDFSYPTYPGASAGWEGISLPFTVEEITVDDGRVLAPFNANVPGAKPFWLRRLTAEGFEDVTRIEAYTPYIIAMPNNAAYDAEYNITGTVTFTAQDGAGIDIPATADMELVRDVGPDFALSCNFTYYPQNSPVYVLNRVDGENYYAGSRFVRNERAAYPFEACISSSALGIAPAYFPVDGGRPGTRTAKKALGPVPQVDDM